MYKYFLLLALLALSKAEEHHPLKEKTQELVKMCAEKNKLSTEVVMKLKDTSVLPSNEHEKCYLECIYEGVSLVENNKLNVEGAKETAHKRYAGNQEMIEKADMTMEYCQKNITPDTNDKCFFGFAIRDCVHKAGHGLTLF